MMGVGKNCLRLAAVSMNQTVYEWARNIRNFVTVIDRAVEDKADILLTEELSLVGYPADDYHQWNKDNALVWMALTYLAQYAASKDPDLIVTAGVPWHYQDKTKAINDPEYNINNRPFNAHAVIMHGRVVAMAAKSILADGPAEYEPRQFSHWPAEKGVVNITLPDGNVIPFGKPMIALNDGQARFTMVYEICAEGWRGLNDDLTIDHREQAEGRYIVALAQKNDLSVVLNPSASKPQPAINKENIRAEGLCKSGSLYAGAYVYANYLGSASGTYGAEGSQLFAQDGAIIHHGARYSFKDVSYSSVVVDLVQAIRGRADIEIQRPFRLHAPREPTGKEAAFDAAYSDGRLTLVQLSYEEYMRSIAIWLRDYLEKQNHAPQGYVISLSGGKDSAYGALAVSTMVDMDVRDNGVEGFFRRFNKLSYQDDVLKIYASEGEAKALQAIKQHLLTCVYLPTENNSKETLHAARFLIEGGRLPDARDAQGIGGKFFIAPVQAVLDEATIAFSGLDVDRVVLENIDRLFPVRDHIGITAREHYDLARAQLLRIIKNYINAPLGWNRGLPDYITSACVNPLVSWSKAADDITLQNIQARIRLPIPWAIGNQERKMPLATSNESEAVHSYTTAGGDMHMGGANPIGGVPKHVITESLEYFERQGLVGFEPVRSLYWINQQQPSAELRRVRVDSAAQTDEGDLGFTYAQSQFIEERLIVARLTPSEVLKEMYGNPLFNVTQPELRDILLTFARRWESGQFKRIMAPLSPHVGSNVDPHQAVRTTVLGDHFRTGAAHMTIDVLVRELGGEEAFARDIGLTVTQAKAASMINVSLKEALLTRSLSSLMDRNTWKVYEDENHKILGYFTPPRPRPHERITQAEKIKAGL